MSSYPVVRQHLAAGRYLSAWRALAPEFSAIYVAAEPATLHLAWEVASRCGADAVRRWLTRRAFACHRDRAFAWNQRIIDLLRRSRAFAAWELLRSPDRPAPRDREEVLLAEIATVRVHCELRDFAAAQAAVERASAIDAMAPALWRERAWVAFDRDDHAGALAVCRQGREQHPDDPPLREMECWLMLQQRDQAPALALLAEAVAQHESPVLEYHYGVALFDAGEFARARDVFAPLATLRPLDRGMRVGAARLAARAARALGDDRGALAMLEAVDAGRSNWTQRLRAHVSSGAPSGSGRRVLPVPYVRQDFDTCSPATMASLLAHAGVEVDQREIAAQITYDGTPSHKEQTWAHERGLVIWFFQFDAEVARELIDRGVPFAISTRYEQSGHRQALVGYDTALGTFVLRDPGHSALSEVDAEWLAKQIAVRGGDCAVVLPQAEAERVPVERLPFLRETTELQRLRRAYESRDLAIADAIAAEVDGWPACAARLEALQRIAHERGDRKRALQLWQEAYAAHSDDGYWQYHLALELQSQDRWGEFAALLERHAGTSPYLAMLYAEHLRYAAPSRAKAEWLARRAIAMLPKRASALRLLGDVLWDDVPRRPLAAELHRLASCLEPLDERLAWSCFVALDQLGRLDEGLAFLRERVAAHGAKSPNTKLTLARALDGEHRRGEALEVLRAALAAHDEPQVRAVLFELLVDDGQLDAAAPLLEPATRWRPMTRARACLRLARARGDLAAIDAALADAVAIDGADAELQTERLRHMLVRQGREATLLELERLIEAHGANPGLLAELQAFCIDIEEYARAEALIRRLVAEHPSEHWLRGRLARLLLNGGRADEAEPIVVELLRERPDSLAVWLDGIDVARVRGDFALALERAKQAAGRWPAEPGILRRQRSLARNAAESAEVVRTAFSAVVAAARPPAEGQLDGLVEAAETDLPSEELVAALAALQARFPAQPAIGRARARLLRGDEPAAACAVSERLVAEFAWQPANWLLHASCLRAAGKRGEERALLERLLARVPGEAQAWIDLGESLEQEGQTQAAMAVYERGLAAVPTSAVLHGMRASLLWDFGARSEAIAAIDRAVALDSGYVWARRVQVWWRAVEGELDAALEAAVACVRDNPRWTAAHDLHALVLERMGRHDERVAALRVALACEPRLGAARLRLLDALTELKRFGEAEAVIEEGLGLLGDDPDLQLRRIALRQVRGEFDAARAELRDLLTRHPDFERGWLRLLAWLDEARRDDELLALAASPPAALAESPGLHGYAADAHWRRNDLAAAEVCLRRALAMAPGYEWARDHLTKLLLEQQRPAEVFALYPGADDPTQLPFPRAAALARAAAATGRREFAERAFLRLLVEADPDINALREVDAALRKGAARAQHRLLREQLAATAQRRDVRAHANLLVVLAARSDWRWFWRASEAFAQWLPADQRVAELAQLLYYAKHAGAKARIVPFARTHMAQAVEQPEAWGRVAYALAGKKGAELLVELTGDRYRQPGMRGWMLANLACALAELRRYDECERVCRYALDELPQDHSVWWHRRYLAEVAYERGEFAQCREWCVMPSAEYPDMKVATLQFDALAQMASVRGWFARRRILSAALPEILRQWHLADADERGGSASTTLQWRRFLRLQPSLRALLMACGKVGRRLLGGAR